MKRKNTIETTFHNKLNYIEMDQTLRIPFEFRKEEEAEEMKREDLGVENPSPTKQRLKADI